MRSNTFSPRWFDVVLQVAGKAGDHMVLLLGEKGREGLLAGLLENRVTAAVDYIRPRRCRPDKAPKRRMARVLHR